MMMGALSYLQEFLAHIDPPIETLTSSAEIPTKMARRDHRPNCVELCDSVELEFTPAPINVVFFELDT